MNFLPSRLLASAGLLFAGALSVHAQTATTWNGTTNNDFNTSTNWSAGTPTTTSNASFTGNAPGTVNVSASDTIQELSFSGASAYNLTTSPSTLLTIDRASATSGVVLADSSTVAQVINGNVLLSDSNTTNTSVNGQISVSNGSTLTFGSGSMLTVNVNTSQVGGTSSATMNILGGFALGTNISLNYNQGNGSVLNLAPTSYSISVGTGVGNVRSATSLIEVGSTFGTNTSLSYTIGGTSAGGSTGVGGGQIYLNANGVSTPANIVIGPTSNTAAVTGTYTFGSNATTAASTSATGNIALVSSTFQTGVTQNYRFDVAANNTLTISGNVTTNTSATGNIFNINKTSTGTLVLTGNGNTYTAGTATTNVMAGTLLANNTTSTSSATGPGAVVVSGGATLGGTGYITGPVTASASNSVIAPGILAGSTGLTAATGMLTLTGGVTAATTGGLTLSLNVNGAAPVSVLSLGGGAFSSSALTLNINDLGGGTLAANTLYTVMSGTGTWTANPTITFGTVPTGFSGASYVYTPTAGADSLQIQFSAVPEPRTWALVAGLALLALGQQARKRFALRA